VESSDTLWTRSIGEGFCLLLPSTQRKIAGAIYRLCNDLAAPLGRDSLTFAELSRFVTEHHERIPWSFEEELATDLLPSSGVTDSAVYLAVFSSINTEEKLEVLLLNAPEPAPEKVEMYLKAIDGALPHLRKLFIAYAKQLPHARGGAPRKLGTPEEQEQVRQEIKDLRGPGTKLTAIYARIAQRHGVSASKIKQIWLDRPK
jgi:hypothetical protein